MDTRTLNAQAVADSFRFVLKAKSAVQACTKAVLKEIPRRLQMRSPIGRPELWASKPKAGYAPGAFIHNWQMGVDAIPTGIVSGVDPSGAVALARMHKSIPRWPVGHVYYFTNNLPYANLLEVGLHSSQVGPGGMVGLTVMEFPAIVREAELNYSKEL